MKTNRRGFFGSVAAAVGAVAIPGKPLDMRELELVDVDPSGRGIVCGVAGEPLRMGDLVIWKANRIYRAR